MKLRFKLDASERGLQAVFGELEAQILQILWERGALKGKEIHEEMGRKKKIAYTTVLTVLDRLSKKGFLKKRKEFHFTVFEPTISRQDFQTLVTRQLITSALNISEELAISAFLDIFSNLNPEELEKLSKFIEEKLNEKNKNY